MPDITMCKDSTCPKNEKCQRYTSDPNPLWQAYFTESPREDKECNRYVRPSK